MTGHPLSSVASSSSADEDAVNEELMQRRFQLMATQVLALRWSFVLITVVMAAIGWQGVPKAIVAVWLASALVIFALRARWLTRHAAMATELSRAKVRGAVVWNAALGSIFGLSALSMFLLNDTLSAVLTTIVVSSAAGAVAISGPLLPVYLAYTISIMLPFAAMWAAKGSPLGIGLALLMGSFVAVQTRFARKVSETFTESFLMRRENEQLVAQLTAARDLAQAEREKANAARDQAQAEREKADVARDQAQAEREKAEAANTAKTRFLAAASHDLRQPLHALGLHSNALSLDPRAEDTPQIAADIAEAIEDVSALLDSLLDISRLDAGTYSANRRPIQLSRMLSTLARSFALSAEVKGLQFELLCPPGEIAITDPVLLERVLRNLVDNAIKFTEAGTISVRLDLAGNHLDLTVRDTGVGIPTELQSKVFDEFYQVNRHAMGHNQGLGLGLSIVSRLAKLLEMPIELSSAPGRGTSVHLRLARADSQATRPEPAKAPAAAPPTAFKGLRVLVIDDEPKIRRGMTRLLRRLECEVAAAASVAEALNLSNQFGPDIVLADYRLSEEATGINAVAQLRLTRPDLKALLISGDTASDRLQEAQASGLQLLTKPATLEKLQRAIGSLVNEAS